MSMQDAYGADPGDVSRVTRLPDVEPEGSDLTINEDGTGTLMLPEDVAALDDLDHYENLALHLDEIRLDSIASDLLDAIETDKEARAERDRQYEEGLRRTGFGEAAPGGADFPGASRATHPLLAEAGIDFAAAVMKEMLPPDGPVKATVVGDETDPKIERAKRVARYMNWQLTEQMQSAYHEFEVGWTQSPLGGAFYTKFYTGEGGLQVAFIPIDHVYRPYNDGDFYQQPRITHRQETDKWTFKDNVRRGLWRDILDPVTSASNVPEQTQSGQANDQIIGRSETAENIDALRLIYETSALMGLEDDDEDAEPYLVTIDVTARKVLSIYRNWAEEDGKKKRLDFLVEWPFWPWRGGYPIGMTHMIGGLTVATTGALRALLDAAHLNNSQTAVKLKGGATAGGQNIKPQVGETVEVQGSLAMDDIRKAYMPLTFNPPSTVLFQLLGFLVDAGRGLVRTTFDEYDKFNGQTPVGTAQMFIEQGMKNFGAVHARQHRSMRRFLKNLYEINGRTINNAEIVDQQGELSVSAADFQGPMVVIPVSDPRIFSDMQRMAQAQAISARATALPQIYVIRKAELNLLEQMRVPNAESYLQPMPNPTRQNAVAENVAASNGGPVKAFAGQDHEAHIDVHASYMESGIFGSNPAIAPKALPILVQHLADHIAQWYGDAMLEAATAALRKTTGNPQLTLQSFTQTGNEVPLDRLMAQIDDEVLAHAQESLAKVPEAIMRAQALIKKLSPPMPMDPTAVAAQDVQRQTTKDERDAQLKVIDFATRKEQMERDGQRKDNESQASLDLKQQKLELDADKDKALAFTAATNADTQARAVDDKLEMNQQDNATALEITEMNNEARAAGGGGSNLKNGTGVNPNP